MSAPPIGMISCTPNTKASTVRMGKSSLADGLGTRTTTIATAAARIDRFTTF
jgi:hypothetical protein